MNFIRCPMIGIEKKIIGLARMELRKQKTGLSTKNFLARYFFCHRDHRDHREKSFLTSVSSVSSVAKNSGILACPKNQKANIPIAELRGEAELSSNLPVGPGVPPELKEIFEKIREKD